MFFDLLLFALKPFLAFCIFGAAVDYFGGWYDKKH